MPKQDITKLAQIIETEVPGVHAQMLHRDSFAMGCYLHLLGKEEAGRKLCNGVLRSLGSNRRETYFRELMADLAGNEQAYVDGINAHHEINALFTLLRRDAAVD